MDGFGADQAGEAAAQAAGLVGGWLCSTWNVDRAAVLDSVHASSLLLDYSRHFGACGAECSSHRPPENGIDSMGDDGLNIEFLARGLTVVGGHVLLCRSVKHGYTYLPGGHVEFGEGAAEAVAREFAEETGEQVRVGEPVHVHEHVFRQRGRLRHEFTVVFHVELATKPPTPGALPEVCSLEKAIDFVWCPAAELEAADLRPASILPWLRQAMTDGTRAGIAWRSDTDPSA